MKLNAKVLIVGGGPAGAIAAGVLAENGTACILLEKNRSQAKPCGGGLTLSAFDEFAIPQTSIVKKVFTLSVISPLGERVDIGLNQNALSLVDRRLFDESLRQRAEEKGAQVIEGEFLGLADNKKITAQALVDGEKVEVQAETLIAADGVNSRVRASLGIKPSSSLVTLSEVAEGLDIDCCEFWFGASHAPQAYSWVFPAAGGVSIGSGSFSPEKIRDHFRSFKARRGITVSGKKKVYRIPVWKGDLYHLNRILFAGDAAGQVMPLSYEGIYYAMKAGELAARALLEKKVGHYKKMWKGQFQKRFLMMEKLEHFFLRSDAQVEKLVALHKRPEVQEASLRLWLRKDRSKQSLWHYARLFGKFLR